MTSTDEGERVLTRLFLGMRKSVRGREALTLKEDLEDASGLLVDQARDSLDTSSSSESSDGRLGDTLAVHPRRERKEGSAEGRRREERGRVEERKKERTCCLARSSCVAWLLPFRVLFRLKESKKYGKSATDQEREAEEKRGEGERERGGREITSQRTFSSSGHG
jgi:hypothetical protein